MNKQERQAKNEIELSGLIANTEAINNLTAKAEPYVKEYWSILKELWTKLIGYNELGVIKKRLVRSELKQLNKEYRLLLK